VAEQRRDMGAREIEIIASRKESEGGEKARGAPIANARERKKAYMPFKLNLTWFRTSGKIGMVARGDESDKVDNASLDIWWDQN